MRAISDPQPGDLAVDATLRSAALRGTSSNGGIEVRRSDLHRKERLATAGTLVLFVVDVSGSMAARRRMEAVKGAVLGLLEDAYMRRDQVAVIAFRGPAAELVLAPTSSIGLAEQALQMLPTGGRTPLAHALSLAAETVDQARQSDQELLVLLVVLTDGKANVPLPGSTGDAWRQALDAAAQLAGDDVTALVLDTDAGLVRAGRSTELAQSLGAEYLTLEDLSADALTLEITQRRGRATGAARPQGLNR
ncbi:MAG TPA: VWA domain-containing protein [Pirellulales bacterium]|nr:VWA domain-containing protein [Pirellulales bacterium]